MPLSACAASLLMQLPDVRCAVSLAISDVGFQRGLYHRESGTHVRMQRNQAADAGICNVQAHDVSCTGAALYIHP